MSYGAERHFTVGSKNPYPSCFFFFPGQMLFPVRDVLYANQGGTTRKKVLKAIILINSAHWGIPAYHLSFLFSVLYTILLCPSFLTVFNVCPARPLAYELQCLHFTGLRVSLHKQKAVSAGSWS